MIAMAADAGREILRIYAGAVTIDHKADGSPATEADRLAEALILERLAAAAPGVPVLAEESAAGGTPELGGEFFLVDPLDGTREFINRNGEFTVNIALIRNQRPVLGVVYAPALSRLYAGGEGIGAFKAGRRGAPSLRQSIRARRVRKSGLVAVASRSHRTAETDAFLESLAVADLAAAGSSLKFCLLAEGSADVYPRFGRTMEWDTAAGQAVLEAAGGRVLVHPDGVPLCYGKSERGFDNPHFIAWGAPAP
jgi:3'(2'), 5'-bisphosphate nucleotidase